MKFELEAILKFSGILDEGKETLRECIDDANKDLLKRGVPKDVNGGASVDEYSAEADLLHLHIVSDRYVRAHDALIRLRKKLSEEMGKKYRIGVRELQIEYYTIQFELIRPPETPFVLPFVDEIKFDNNSCTISVKSLTEEQLSNNYVDRIIQRIKEKIDAQYYGGKEELWNLVWASGEKNIAWEKDPTEEMEKLGWIKQGPTKGKWFYRPQAAKILRCMEEIAIKEVLEPLGFQEVIESMMVPFDVWQKTGHMEGVPNEVYYVCEPKSRDPKEWEELVDVINITQDVPLDKLKELISPPRAGISYAQCPIIYWSLKNSTVADDSLPILLYDKTVPSARYESGGRHGIERVDEFHRIEPVYIGTKEQLLKLKEDLIDRYKHVFQDILDLEWRMAKVAPFYMQQSGHGSDEVEEEDLGTIDFEAYMPYRGTREESEWLEFQNLSIFKKYTKSFNIKSQSKELYSGCSGIGLERWASAFLAQKGLDPEAWPKEFRKRCGDLPKGLNLL